MRILLLVCAALALAVGLIAPRLWKRAKFAWRFYKSYRHAQTPGPREDAYFEWSTFVWCIVAWVLLISALLGSVALTLLALSEGWM